jgi:hypothetical protein
MMPLKFEATKDFHKSVSSVNTLIEFATIEREKDNDENRVLFLKLAVVSSVTKFQVFIEGVLKEYLFLLKSSNKKHHELSTFLRLNAIRIFSSGKIIHKALENPETYNDSKLVEIKGIVEKTLAFCIDAEPINENLQFETRFPLGKTGLNELVKLFKQVNGEDIFAAPPFDTNKLNEILSKRHAIIHEDANPQITETIAEQYRDYITGVADYIDIYLSSHI